MSKKRVSQSTSGATTKGGRARATKDVKYPIFEECADLIDDEYWVDIFKLASYGKFPKKFTYRNGVLSFKKGAKTETLSTSGSAEDILHELLDFFRRNAGFMSLADEKSIITERDAQSQDFDKIWSSWKNLKKSTRKQLIDSYIMKSTQRFFLNKFEEAQLREVIALGLANKTFNENTIVLRDTCIDSIIGLCYNSTTRKFYINSPPKKSVTRTKKIDNNEDESKSIDNKAVTARDISFLNAWTHITQNYSFGNRYRDKRCISTAANGTDISGARISGAGAPKKLIIKLVN